MFLFRALRPAAGVRCAGREPAVDLLSSDMFYTPLVIVADSHSNRSVKKHYLRPDSETPDSIFSKTATRIKERLAVKLIAVPPSVDSPPKIKAQ